MTAIPRVGVVGVGRFGQNHSRIYSELSCCEFVGIYDINPTRGKEISSRDNVPLYPSYQELLKDIDFISVVTPTATHFQVAQEALRSGKHTLVEKPIAAESQESEQLIALAEQAGVDLLVGHLERFNAAFQKAKSLLDDFDYISCQRLGTWVGRKVTVDVVSDLMIHDIDILNLLDQTPVTSVKASGKKIVSPYPDFAGVWLEFESGLKANLTADRVNHRRYRELLFQSDNQIISVDMMNQQVKLSQLKDSENSGFSDMEYSDVAIERSEPLKAELIAFLTRDGSNIAKGPDGKKALDVALRILEVIDEC